MRRSQSRCRRCSTTRALSPSARASATSPSSKDRAALAKLIVAKGFFWLQDKDLADPSKSGIDNLAKAIDLDSKAGNGWETIAEAAAEPTAAGSASEQGDLLRAGSARFRSAGLRQAPEGDGDRVRYHRVGLSRLRTAWKSARRRNRTRKSSTKWVSTSCACCPTAHRPTLPARHRSCTWPYPTAKPVTPPPSRSRRSLPIKSATSRMRAAGRSPAISAAAQP